MILRTFYHRVTGFRSLILTAVFAFLSASVFWGWWGTFDWESMPALQKWGSRPLDCAVTYFSYLGFSGTSAVLGGVLCIWLWGRYSFITAVSVVLALGLSTAVELVLKNYMPQSLIPESFYRGCMETLPLPHFHLPTAYSYPSGHTLRTAFLASIFAKALRDQGAGRWILWAAGILIVLMSVTRVYIGDHWSSDVAGGLLLAAMAYSWVIFKKA